MTVGVTDGVPVGGFEQEIEADGLGVLVWVLVCEAVTVGVTDEVPVAGFEWEIEADGLGVLVCEGVSLNVTVGVTEGEIVPLTEDVRVGDPWTHL